MSPNIRELLEMLNIEDLEGDMQDVAETIGMAAFRKLVEIHGGEMLYIPSPSTITTLVRHELIRRDFNGSNHKELARRWGITTRRVYQIIAKAKEEGRERNAADKHGEPL